MIKYPANIKKAEKLKPKLIFTSVSPKCTLTPVRDGEKISIRPAAPLNDIRLSHADKICLDFGTHLVGYPVFSFSSTGAHQDAPAWIKISFAERLSEFFENAEEYSGWISRGWIQQEQLHIDCLPHTISMPRRYAFRYIQIEVLDVSSKYQLCIDSVSCNAVSSADDSQLSEYDTNDEQLKKIYDIACRTLHNCMQLEFEDGPKRDRRLWLGDLRLQALANYQTYKNNDLVKRCLYLFASSVNDDGQLSACVFTEPEIEADDTKMFDYSLLFAAALRDYWKETGDKKTLAQLWPFALNQFDVADKVIKDSIVEDSDRLGWCFIDWNLALNKQASAQGVYLYCARAALEIAEALKEKETVIRLKKRIEEMIASAIKHFYDEEKKLFKSGSDSQISWASQIWMILGGVVSDKEAAELLERVAAFDGALEMTTPYLYHHYVEALILSGQKEKALDVIKSYWGGMADNGADTFWELYNPENPDESPYGGTIVNSYCHAWSCAPAYFLKKYF